MTDTAIATEDNPVRDILKRAKELISVPERWTTKTSARDHLNAECSATDPFAARWCLLGALHHEAPITTNLLQCEPFWDARRLVREASEHLGFGVRELGGPPISATVDANDNGGFSAVHKVLDRAIYMAGEAQ